MSLSIHRTVIPHWKQNISGPLYELVFSKLSVFYISPYENPRNLDFILLRTRIMPPLWFINTTGRYLHIEFRLLNDHSVLNKDKRKPNDSKETHEKKCLIIFLSIFIIIYPQLFINAWLVISSIYSSSLVSQAQAANLHALKLYTMAIN